MAGHLIPGVAPHPGARIETAPRLANTSSSPVAPHPGARIETACLWSGCYMARGRSPSGSADRNVASMLPPPAPGASLPIRERGSKPHRHRQRLRPAIVAPHPGARIETGTEAGAGLAACSRSPSGSADRNDDVVVGSRGQIGRSPSGSADRNLVTALDNRLLGVAPHPGARIETPMRCATRPSRRVAPHPGARIETHWRCAGSRRSQSLPIRERGSKQRPHARPLRNWVVAPHPGARIETSPARWSAATMLSLPIRERGSKPQINLACSASLRVAPHPGARIETPA